MSGSGRKRSSKWDMDDDPEFAPDSKHLRGGWSSRDVSGSNDSKWSYVEGNERSKRGMGKEPFSGGRGSYKDDMNRDYRVLDAKMEWESDASYSKKISPVFEESKHKRRSQSPKNGRSRSGRSSRSRSPAHGFRLDSGLNDRNRMRDSLESKNREDAAPRYSAPHESRDHSLRSGRSNGTCLHFAKGRCRMGASCKYVHDNNSDGYGKGSVDELTREREHDGRRRDNSFEQGGGHMPTRGGETLCKFFANGNCRNGKNCRFSHDQQASRSPNRRLRGDSWGSNPGGDHQTFDRPKLSDSLSPSGRFRSDRRGTDSIMAEVDKVWHSPKRNDIVAVSDSIKLVEDKSGNKGAAEPELTVWPTKDGWGHSSDKSRVQGELPFSSDKKDADHCIAGNAVADIRVSQSIGTDIWSGHAEMSPDWNYTVGSSSRIEEKHGQNNHGLTQGDTYFATAEHGNIQVTPGQGFDQNVHNINAMHPSSFHSVGQSQAAVPILPSKAGTVESMQNQEVSAEKEYVAEPNIIDAAGSSQISSRNPPVQDMVSKEQLAQLNNLSASLAHILGSGQQLPQLYAALNSHNAKETPSLVNTEGPTMPISNTFVKPDPAVGLSKPYDPMCDSIEPTDAGANEVRPTFSPSKKIAVAVESPTPMSNTGRQNCGDSLKAACSEEQLVKSENQVQFLPGQNIEINKENNEVVAEERQNSQDDHKNTKENGPSENMDQNGGPDEAKKTKDVKDVKGIRAFKFSLVEFVKELLKPAWKEGRINKEDYKTIVKKVVDKVTGTMQGAQIPQTQEKIDHYLSFSKPKLNKLVQAYVEKVQKA